MADQDFIAHARQDIPLLLAEISRLKTIKGGLTGIEVLTDVSDSEFTLTIDSRHD